MPIPPMKPATTAPAERVVLPKVRASIFAQAIWYMSAAAPETAARAYHTATLAV